MLWVSGKDGGHRQGELTAADGVVIPYREWWRPAANGVVIYLHGQGDHSGPFTAMGDLLHELGYNVYAHDHRGFGLSQERRGDIKSYETFIDDVMTMLAHARRQNPGKPAFLLGLSMGGHLALRSAYRAGKSVAGAIALSPGFKLRTPPPWRVVLKTVLFSILTPLRYIPVMGSVVTTRNQVHLARAGEDEHYVNSFTARFFVEAVRSIHKAMREIRQLRVPVLILQAGDDFLISPEENRRVYDRISHPDKRFRLLDGLCHNLVVEPEMPDIAREIAEWIDQRVRTDLRLV
ncbi:MAG TPA: alpha/beta fold hydrolase [Symbiobacteriaceae bacterium]|jgi:lysophospholipase